MDSSDGKINRREFLQKGTVVAAGSATLSSAALSYARIVGANDRISLGHIGIGNRGRELDGIVGSLKDAKNAEVTAVCDLWGHNLEQAVAARRHGLGNRLDRCLPWFLQYERFHVCTPVPVGLASLPPEVRSQPGAR